MPFHCAAFSCKNRDSKELNLGGSLKPDSNNSIFPHPCLSEMSAATVFDPCHMIKLLRNLFNEYEIINVPGISKAKLAASRDAASATVAVLWVSLGMPSNLSGIRPSHPA